MNSTFAVQGSKAFQVLGHHARLGAFQLINEAGEEGLTPSQMMSSLHIHSADLSRHLRKMIAAGLVSVTKAGKNQIYRANKAFSFHIAKSLMDTVMTRSV